MAKKTMRWSLDEAKAALTCEHIANEKVISTQVFNMPELFYEWADMDSVQKQVAAYGLKQKMADACAVTKDMEQTVNERIVTIDSMWARLSVDRNFVVKGGERETLKKKLEGAITEGKVTLTPELAEVLRALGVKC